MSGYAAPYSFGATFRILAISRSYTGDGWTMEMSIGPWYELGVG